MGLVNRGPARSIGEDTRESQDEKLFVGDESVEDQTGRDPGVLFAKVGDLKWF